MELLKKIDNIANLWEKTKDPKYKNLWYKLLKEFENYGHHNSKRRTVPTNSSDKRNNAKHKITR